MKSQVTVASYLFTRLRQLGVRSVHGVPGDFFLKALDQLQPAGLRWVGNCNELNAAYAADGYARVKGISALFTTFGVGEMSAYNAVAGSFCEHAPVVHIVGTPSRRIQKSKVQVHHSLGDGRMDIFLEMFKNVTAAQADLQDPAEAPEQIDSVLKQALLTKKPVYIGLPSDVIPRKVSPAGLERSLHVDNAHDQEDTTLEKVVQQLSTKIQKAKRPLILVDGLCPSFHIVDEVNELVISSKIPTMCYPFGKGIVDEDLPNFHGVHAGKYGRVDNTQYTDRADLVLLFGPLLADNNTTGFSTIPDPSVTVTFTRATVQMPDGQVLTMNVQSLLRRLNEDLKRSSNQMREEAHTGLRSPKDWHLTLNNKQPVATSLITQDRFYSHISRILRAHDTICLANGTPLPGGRDLLLQDPSRILSSSIFLSVGHWLPAAQGAALALRDIAEDSTSTSLPLPHPAHYKGQGRVILLEGDGSFQATCQELSTIIRLRLPMTIFIMNNRGYTYERLIHGMDESYNDVGDWDYTAIPAAMGGLQAVKDGYRIRTWKVRTWSELDECLEDIDQGKVEAEEGLRLVEVLVDPHDGPGKLSEVCRKAGDALDG